MSDLTRNCLAGILAATCLPLLILATGCGSGESIGIVEGIVQVNGRPVPSGTIIFEVTGARPATGKIVDGKITGVTTNETGDGVPTGMAKIAIYATEASDAVEPGPAIVPDAPNPGAAASSRHYMGMNNKSLIPKHYNDPRTSGLTWEIKKGRNTVELDLQPAG